MSKILVMILKLARKSRENEIRKIFEGDSRFAIQTYSPEPLPVGNFDAMTEEELRETLMSRKALSAAREIDSAAAVLVIRDDTISVSDTIPDVIFRALNHPFNLLYLCKWMDKCQMHIPLDRTSTEVPALVKTRYPQGLQAILFHPTGRDIILGLQPMSNKKFFGTSTSLSTGLRDEIFKGNISAICTVPNVFEFDTYSNATSNSDFLKLNECSQVETTSSSNSGSASLLWFILVVIIALVVAWAIITLTSKWKRVENKKKLALK